MRLLYCRADASLEEIPDLGRELDEGEADPLIERVLMRHYERDYAKHGGGTAEEMAPFRIFVVDDEQWRNERTKCIDVINEQNKTVGFNTFVTDAVDTYKEDAMRCYNQHRRPERCVDWMSDEKRIGRPTEFGQRAVKENYKLGQRDPHLCDFCPCKVGVQTEVNFRAGLYKE